MNFNKLILLSGVTGCGKSYIIDIMTSILLSNNSINNFDIYIINSDSRQVYSEIPTITASPKLINNNNIKYCIYNYLSVFDYYSIAHWLSEMKLIFHKISQNIKINNRSHIIFIVGGTPMYLYSFLCGLHDSNNKNIFFWKGLIDGNLNDIDHNWDAFLLIPDRKKIKETLSQRIYKMIDDGIISEITKILQDERYIKNCSKIDNIACGMKGFIDYINGAISLQKAIDQAILDTNQYLKHQYTWFNNSISHLEGIKTFSQQNQLIDYMSNKILKFA
ncbi:MAG: hypothetical protein OEY79_01295 [Anaplasmataceae bacterium]|nr:hypothetical protein [Anaplasmataceae bacterium]